MKSPIIAPIALLALLTLAACQDETPPPEQSESRPALTVELARPETANWVRSLSANGNVAAWQEAVIGAEVAGYRIAEVPTTWSDRGGSKLKIGRTSLEMFMAICRLRLLYSPFRWIVTIYDATMGRIVHLKETT